MVLGTGVKNHNEFFTDLYLSEAIIRDIKPVLDSWVEMKANGSIEKTRWETLRSFRERFLKLKERTSRFADHGHIREQQNLIADIIRASGYTYERSTYTCDQELSIPVVSRVNGTDGAPKVLILEVLYEPEVNPQDMSILSYSILPKQYAEEVPEEQQFPSGTSYDELVTKYIFSDDEPPRWVLIVGAETILLIDRSKWPEKRMLEFDLTEIYDAKDDELFKLVSVLISKEQLAPTHGENLLDTMNENSHQHAYDVSEDLKYSVRECVEILGNEVLARFRAEGITPLPSADDLSIQALRWMYRLLFLFYIEARPELEYIPLDNELYMKGYSLESLREITDGPEPDADAEGTYLHESLKLLFRFVQEGISREVKTSGTSDTEEGIQELFTIDSLQSHLFDPANTKDIGRVSLRNAALFKIIQNLSLTKVKGNRRRGRVSYSHLGINQLGSVYEGLLSYRGFYAEKDLYEVKKKGEDEDPLNQAFFVSYDELEEYADGERVYQDDGTFKKYPAGTYIYRLAGRDREKSASYYTPHVLTECLVKYTLKELLKDIETDEILDLTICEPAMGSAAFINEAIDQLSEAYLTRKQKETGIVIPQDEYIIEKQKVKMHIADHNVYGVDLNPIAVELAEVSLWLNTIHKGAHVPWFSLQLKCGNSLIGARRQFFYRSQVVKSGKNSYLKEVPKRFDWKGRAVANRIYHFLLPDENMASYSNKVIKDLEPDKIKKIDAWRKSFATPLSESEADKLVEISKSVDLLWKLWSGKLKELRRELTDEVTLFDYETKESHVDLNFKDNAYRKELSSSGKKTSSEYLRLKLAMDYWCALWFWPIEKADQLPSRSEYIQDMEEILIGTRTDLPDGSGQLMFIDFTNEEHPEGILSKTGIVNLEQFEAHHPHLHTVHQIAKTYRFHHWELEYADIFEDRGGFDLILGNPPWLKVEWKENNVLSDFDPRFIIKTISISDTEHYREVILNNVENKKLFCSEYVSSVGSNDFIRSYQNYPLMQGQMANLYKPFIPLSWYLGSTRSKIGLLHPESIYDDPKGGAFREESYKRLIYHFQFENQKKLFKVIGNTRKYGINIYSSKTSEVNFYSIYNLYLPKTIYTSFNYVGENKVEGIKDEQSNWNVRGNSSRIIHITQAVLLDFSKLYGNHYSSIDVPLIKLHTNKLISVINKIGLINSKLGDFAGEYYVNQLFDEAKSKKEKILFKGTGFPESDRQLVISSPQIYVGNLFHQTPRRICNTHRAYDSIDLLNISKDYLPRTNFNINSSRIDSIYRMIPQTPWGNGIPITNFYRLVNRERVDLLTDRTMISCILPPHFFHISSVVSTTFKSMKLLLSTFTYTISVPFDFLIKTTGINIRAGVISRIQVLSINKKAICRALLLSVLTEHFSTLWSDSFNGIFREFSWTKKDPRLRNSHFEKLTPEWTWDTPLRTDYARRQALVEIDVLVAQAMGLTLEELQTIYRIQFPVMQQYEKETYYDQKGRIVFTVNKGLSGVGFPRKGDKRQGIIGWEDIYDMTSGTVSRVITDDTLPGGPVEREIVYYAPFDRCDRESDYATAWAEFERRESL